MDILILAAIAIFIFVKLREQFGKIDEEQKRDSIRNFIDEQVKLTNKSPIDRDSNQNKFPLIVQVLPHNFDSENQRIIDGIDVTIRQNFIDIMQRSGCLAKDFLSGANKAFAMVIENFVDGNLDNLKLLLDEKLFSSFESSIKERKAKNHVLKTKIVSIDDSKIIDAKIVRDFAFIKVKFASKQINYVLDDLNNLVNGSKEEIASMTDIWNFKKDLNMNNPNWLLLSTN